MATFKLWDKARLVNVHPAYAAWERAEVAIIGLPGCDSAWPDHYEIDGPMRGPFTRWYAAPPNLAPLTDPKADAFIEQVKKWKPEPEITPLRVEELEHIRGGA